MFYVNAKDSLDMITLERANIIGGDPGGKWGGGK